jgi:hypothetical protein
MPQSAPFLCTLIVLCGITIASGQWVQDFDTGDLSEWTGDVNDFIINDNRELQLSAPEAGTSTLLARVPFPDSLTWDFRVHLDFAPSGSNKLEVWLALDGDNPDTANGYKLEIGESGSDDAIRFSALTAGNETLLAEGIMGEVGAAFDLDIQLTLDSEELWTLETSLSGSSIFNESFVVSSTPVLPQPEGFFGVTCTYTSGRVDLFTFDDFRIGLPEVDLTPPTLLTAQVVDETKVILQFDEALEPSSLLPLSQYSASIPVTEAVSSSTDPNTVCLTLGNALPSGQALEMTVSGLQDRSGNVMMTTSVILILTEDPIPGDLVINEILFDPLSGNSADFVEVINISDKRLRLDNLFFARENSTAVDVAVPDGFELGPDEIIAFTPDTTEIIETYQPVQAFNLQELDLTNYVQGEGNVSIKIKTDTDTVIIDSFDYSDDFHSSLLTASQTKGISLERISPSAQTNDGDNWSSAAESVNFATPGYANSQRATGLGPDEGMIGLEEKVFSPDGDGFQDQLRLLYTLDRTGFIANATVYDDRGHRIQNIAANKLLGQSGVLLWDGLLADGSVAPIGIYILQYDIFHDDGTVLTGKEVFVLAQYLNR